MAQLNKGGQYRYADPTFWQAMEGTGMPELDNEYEQTVIEWVYFLWSIDARAVRIGVTRNLETRIDTHRGSNPSELRLLRTLRGGHALEKVMHERFDQHKLRGSWYSDAIIADVLAL